MMVVLNAVLFQIAWFGCVLGGARDQWWWGALGVVAMYVFCLWRGSAAADTRLLLMLAIAGLLLDSLWATTGILDYGSATTSIVTALVRIELAPVWIILLWTGVALSVRHSMAIFTRHPLIGAALAGAAAVPSYLGGERLGAVIVPENLALGFISLAWACVFFLLFSRSTAHSGVSGD